MNAMEGASEKLGERLFELVAYLITSAQGLFQEPASYGPLRLLEAAKRLLELMEEQGLASKAERRLKNMIEENMHLVLSDEEEFQRFVDRLVEELASIIASRKA